ncbi:MAG: hypothetical protein ACYC35_02185 [Pirellulales bacterium]
MKLWHLLIGGLVLAALSGCRSNGSQEWLESEMRQLEDQVYQYQDEARRSQKQLEACQRENDALRKKLESKGGQGGAGANPTSGAPEVNVEVPGAPDGTSLAPPSVDAGTAEPADGAGAKTPETLPEPGRTSVNDLREGESKAPATTPEAPAATPETPEEQGPTINPVPSPGVGQAADSARVSTLAINRLLTGGFNTDGKPGDQGVTAVVEPRDSNGDLVNAPGAVSVVVVDPTLEGSRQRVARWDFTADQTASHFRQTALGKGLHLELPWPNRPPTNGHLKLYVRYQTRDGRKLIAQRDIDIDAPGRRPSAAIADSSSSSVPRATTNSVTPKASAPASRTSPAPKASRAWTAAPVTAKPIAAKPVPTKPATPSLPKEPAASSAAAPAAETPSWTPSREETPARGPSETAEPPRATSQARRPEWRPYR